MEEIGVLEAGEDIGGTQFIVGKDFGIRKEDLVSYAAVSYTHLTLPTIYSV